MTACSGMTGMLLYASTAIASNRQMARTDGHLRPGSSQAASAYVTAAATGVSRPDAIVSTLITQSKTTPPMAMRFSCIAAASETAKMANRIRK